MPRWWHRRRLPAALRPTLDPDDRVVGWALTTAGEAVVATRLGLYLPGRARLGWHEIHKAVWSGETLTVVPSEVVARREGYVVTADTAPVSVTLPEPGNLPQAVRARVTRSVSFSAHHRLPGGGVRVVARRVPGRDGLSWAVRYDPGTDPAAPAVTAATDQFVAGHVAATEGTS